MHAGGVAQSFRRIWFKNFAEVLQKILLQFWGLPGTQDFLEELCQVFATEFLKNISSECFQKPSWSLKILLATWSSGIKTIFSTSKSFLQQLLRRILWVRGVQCSCLPLTFQVYYTALMFFSAVLLHSFPIDFRNSSAVFCICFVVIK